MKKKNVDFKMVSAQSELFCYLKPEQQEYVKPVLRVLKKPAQEELCVALLDYMETGEVILPADFTLAAFFYYLTRTGDVFDDEPGNKRIIRPLQFRSKAPQKASELVNRFFRHF